jgi:uncharacterized RDD family membrane protein YckC
MCTVPLEGAGKVLYSHMVCEKCHQDFALRRVLAHFLDLMILQVAGFILGIAIFMAAVLIGAAAGAASGNDDFGARLAVLIWVLMLLVFLFFVIAKDGFSGYSPVKYFLGLRVIDAYTGRPAGFLDSFKRNLPVNIPFMPIYVFYQLLTRDGTRLGDGWAGTKVIWKKYADKELFLSERERQNRARARIAASLQTPSRSPDPAAP